MGKTVVKIAAIGAGLAAGSLALSPALSTVRSALISTTDDPLAKVSLKALGSIGSFTPVTRDGRLARAYAQAARDSHSRGFRFTPTAGSISGERSLTVLVRAGDGQMTKRMLPDLGIAPVAYSLRAAKGLARFADAPVETEELRPITEPVQMPTANFVLNAKPSRFSTDLALAARAPTSVAPTADTPQTLGSEKTYTVNLSSSYSLTRNLNVQAGLRYRGPDNRLVPLTDQKQDSQAVYVGTTFKF